MLSVLTRASTHNLVTLSRVRLGVLGSSSDDSQDELLEELISGASESMAGYWGRPFARQRYQYRVAGNGGCRLLLPVYPIDPDSVTMTIDDEAETDFVVLDPAIGLLYRGSGWPGTVDVDEPLNVVVTFHAGWLVPDQIADFAITTVKTAGQWVRPSSPILSPLLFEVTTAGTTGGSEPTWPTDAGDTVESGTAIFTGRAVDELPRRLFALAYVEVWHRYQNRAPGLAGQSADGFSEQYFATHTDTDLSYPVRAGLDRLRAGGIA
jgi:hypothetical protein